MNTTQSHAGLRARLVLLLTTAFALVAALVPVGRVGAAGDGVLSVTVSILDAGGNPVSVIDPAVSATYSVNIAYGCSTAACENTTIFVAPTPLDPYYGTRRKEANYTVTPPAGVTPTVSGNVNTGITINLGTLPVGTSTALRVNYGIAVVNGTVSGSSFFPTGSVIAPQVTLSSPTAVGDVTGTANATWQIGTPEPVIQVNAPARTRTDTEVTLNLGVSNNGCVRRVNGVWNSVPTMICGSGYSATVELPANATHVSGGTYDEGTHSVTWGATGNTVAAAAGHGAGAEQIVVSFASDLYPTANPQCIVSETFDITYDITYLNGEERSATLARPIEVQNCTPFAKASLLKAAYLAGAQFSTTTLPVPLTPGTTRGFYWDVSLRNQANVAGVATIVDNSLDIPDLPVNRVLVAFGGPATVEYTLDNGDTGTVVLNNNASWEAPADRRLTGVTATSSELVGPNTLPNQTGVTPFEIRFFGTLAAEANLGERTNTATGVMDYPDYPELDPLDLEIDRTIEIVSEANIQARAEVLAASLGTPPVTPVAGSEVQWQVRPRYVNVPVASPLVPQMVFIAPAGWEIVADGASMDVGAPAGVTFDYRSVTFQGVVRQAVVATWPGPIGLTGDNTLPRMFVRTVPTTSAPAGTANQTATLLVGDAENVDAAGFNPGPYVDASDVDGDGLTTETFAVRNANTDLAPTLGIGAVKQICRPNPMQVDGCDWISDSSVQVGVPPTATSITYRVIIENRGNAALSSIVAYDVLPFIGDTGLTDATAATPRGSTVAEQVVTVSQVTPGLTLTYSTSTNPLRPEVYSGGGTTGTFTGTVAGARSIRMAIASLPAGESRSFVYEAELIGAAADQVACNSVAVTAATLNPTEPPAVCATTQEADFSLLAADRYPLQVGRPGVVPFVVNQGGGSQAASGVVTIDVPAEVELVDLEITPGWRCTAPGTTGPVTVSCVPVNVDTTTRALAIDEPETISLLVAPAPGTQGDTLCFSGLVAGLIHDPVDANNAAEACSLVVAAGGLSVEKDDGIAIVGAGTETTYTITVGTDLVGEIVSGAELTDELPDNATFVSATPSATLTGANGDGTGGTLTWTLTDLGPAGTVTSTGTGTSGGTSTLPPITVTVQVADDATGTVTNTASVSAPDPVMGGVLEASGSDVDDVQGAAIELEKTASPAFVASVGAVVTYTFDITNTGNVALDNVTVLDDMPGLTDSTCPIGLSLPAGASTTCTMTYAATPDDFAAGEIVNTATVSGQPAIGPAAVSPDATATVLAAAAPGLWVEKTAVQTDFDEAGDVIDFTITVTNSGNVTLSNLSVIDELPGTTPVNCGVTTLLPGANVVCTTSYAVTAVDLNALGLINTARAAATAPGGVPVSSPPAIAFVPAIVEPVVLLDKFAAETSFDSAGDTLHYSLVVTNAGNVTLTNIQVTDSLGIVVTCPTNTLQASASMTCTASYTTDADDVANLEVVNEATVTADSPVGAVTDSDEIDVPLEALPAISLVKTAFPSEILAANTTITYTFLVSNTGNVTLTDVGVVDTFPGLSPVVCPSDELAMGASMECAATYLVTQDDIDENDQLINTATASGDAGEGFIVVSEPASAPVPPYLDPRLGLVKSSPTGSFDAAGDEITFEFVAANTGNMTLFDVSIVDPLPGVVLSGCSAPTLSPGSSLSCQGTYTATQADVDAGFVRNTAVAAGATASGEPVTSVMSDVDVFADQMPSVTLTKSAVQSNVTAAGQPVMFTFVVTNAGNVSLTSIEIIDLLSGVSVVTCGTNMLLPGDSTNCTASYTTTQNDIDSGHVYNTASVSAMAGTQSTGATASFDLPALRSPSLSVEKEALASSYDSPDDVLAYTITINNTGNVTISDITVVEELPGATLLCPPITELAPGDDALVCTVSYTTVQADVDAGRVDNSVTVDGIAAGGTEVGGAASASVTAVQNPEIELAKTADLPDGLYDAAGIVVTYTVVATNVGNVTLTNVAVTDTMDGLSEIDCDGVELAPGESIECTATYTTTQADVDAGNIVNTADVEATAPDETTVDGTASATLTAVQAPAATFTKQVSDGFEARGDVLEFTLTVTNTGNVTLTDIEITDELPGVTVECPATSLAPGGTLECTATYTVTQDDVDLGVVINTAHLTANPPTGDPIELQSSAVATGTQSPAIALVKSALEPSFAAAGQTLNYTFVVTNTGNVTLHDVTVTDPLPGLSAVTCPVDVLAPGESTTCTATYTTTQADVDAGGVNNTATATGFTPVDAGLVLQAVQVSVTAASAAFVPAVQSPGLHLVKVVEEINFSIGTTLHYRFEVTNIGNTTVTDIAIDDPLPGLSEVVCPATELAPGASMVCTATYVATAADVARGRIDNTATAVGTPDGTAAVASQPSTVGVSALVTPPGPGEPQQPTPPPGGGLPSTGGAPALLLRTAVLLTLLGALVVAATSVRRRRHVA